MQSLLTNAAIASAGHVLKAALGIVVIALITRLLGPEQFGLYAALLSLGTILQLTADFGLYLTLTRQVAATPGRITHLLSHTISLRLALLALAFTIGLGIIATFPALSGTSTAYLILALGFAVQSLSQLFMGIYQQHRAVWRATIGDLAGRLIQIAVIVIAATAAVTLNTIALAFTAGTSLAFIIHHKLLPSISYQFRYDRTVWAKLLKETWPLGVVLLLNVIYFRVDILVLTWFRSAREVGQYALAYRVIENGLFFPAMLGGLLLPRITEALTAQKHQQVLTLLQEGFRLLAVTGAALLLLLIILSQDIVTIIGGAEYIAATPLLSLLSWALLSMFIGNLFGFTLVAQGRHFFLLRLYIVLVIVNFIGNLLLIPIWGAQAAAITTIATEVLATTIAGLAVYRSLNLPPPISLILRIVTITALSWACAQAFRSVLLQVPLAILLYAALSFQLRTLAPSQINLLRTKHEL